MCTAVTYVERRVPYFRQLRTGEAAIRVDLDQHLELTTQKAARSLVPRYFFHVRDDVYATDEEGRSSHGDVSSGLLKDSLAAAVVASDYRREDREDGPCPAD